MQRLTCFFIVVFLIVKLSAQSYDPDAAVVYCEQWVYGFNTIQYNDYENYPPYGGDCANFVSQCLR